MSNDGNNYNELGLQERLINENAERAGFSAEARIAALRKKDQKDEQQQPLMGYGLNQSEQIPFNRGLTIQSQQLAATIGTGNNRQPEAIPDGLFDSNMNANE